MFCTTSDRRNTVDYDRVADEDQQRLNAMFRTITKHTAMFERVEAELREAQEENRKLMAGMRELQWDRDAHKRQIVNDHQAEIRALKSEHTKAIKQLKAEHELALLQAQLQQQTQQQPPQQQQPQQQYQQQHSAPRVLTTTTNKSVDGHIDGANTNVPPEEPAPFVEQTFNYGDGWKVLGRDRTGGDWLLE